jgi:hypothetical protein
MNKTKKILIILFSLILTINVLAQNIEKPDGTLPVTMVYFFGDVVGSTVEIKWGTATEINNYGYFVHRSDTSFVWEELDFMEKLGASYNYTPLDYVYIDTTITKNGNYFYRLKQMDVDGNFELTHDTVKVIVDYITSINEENQTKDSTPENFELFQNYPNPFNPETNIPFTMREQDFVSLKLYAISGEEVETVFSGIVTSGTHLIKFKPKNLSSGTYIYKFSVHNKSVSKKMIFIK